MKPKGKVNPVLRILNATKYSIGGLISSWKDEQAFRQEVSLCLILTPLAILIPVSLNLKLLILFSMFVVLIAELLNSAIEAVADLVTEDFHELIKKAKDCGSAAVFLSLICSGIIWVAAIFTWLSGRG